MGCNTFFEWTQFTFAVLPFNGTIHPYLVKWSTTGKRYLNWSDITCLDTVKMSNIAVIMEDWTSSVSEHLDSLCISNIVIKFKSSLFDCYSFLDWDLGFCVCIYYFLFRVIILAIIKHVFFTFSYKTLQLKHFLFDSHTTIESSPLSVFFVFFSFGLFLSFEWDKDEPFEFSS